MSISRKFQRSKSKYTLSQKIISAVTAAGFIMQPFTAFAGEIIKPGGNNLINDKVANIWADKVVGNAAVNVFDKFNLSANEIANMYFGTSKENHNAANLVNFVNDRIDINGTVNAIQNNKIGGNLFFLSKEGMAVGKSGVINTGSLYVMTPTQDFMEDMQRVVSDADVNTAAENIAHITNITTDAASWQAIPLNSSGTITVLGKVNAVNEVHNTTNAFIEGNGSDNKVVITTVDGGIVDVIAQDVAIAENSIYEQALDGLADGKEEIAERMGSDFDITGESELNGIETDDIKAQLNNKEAEGTGTQSNENSTEEVNLNKDSGSSIITVAGGLAATTGKGAGGAAVAITDIENNYTANVEYADITAEKLNAEAGSDSNIVTVSGGIAAASKGSGVGSITWNDLENTAKANIKDSVVNAQTTLAKAVNKAQIVSVAGQISGAGKAGVGATLSYIGLDNSTEANITNTTFDKRYQAENEGITVNADAENSSDSYNVAAGVSAAGTAAVSGNVAVTQTHGTSGAVIDSAIINNAKAVSANALDDTDILSVIGTVSAAGTASVGAGVAYTEIGSTSTNEDDAQQTVAEVKNTNITTVDNSEIKAKAEDDSRVINVAVGIGGAGTAAVQGASATSLINKTTGAELTNTNIDKDSANSQNANVTVDAQNNSEITSSADVASVAGNAGVGAGVAVNRIVQNTNAVVNSGTMHINNLTVNANGTPRIENIGIGVGAGGTAGVTGSVAVNMIANNVTAHIGNGANIVAGNNVGVVATSDEQIANYAGQASVAGTGAAVGLSVSYNELTGNTTAIIDGDTTSVSASGGDALEVKDTVDDGAILDKFADEELFEAQDTLGNDRKVSEYNGVAVSASSTHAIKSFLVNGGVAGEGAAVNGTVNVNQIGGSTKAAITDADINTAGTAGDVNVIAHDYTNSAGLVGSASVAGVGAGVGLGSDTNTVSREVTAEVVGKTDSDGNAASVINASAFNVEADAQQGISSLTVGLGAAGIGAGVSNATSVTLLDGKTTAKVAGVNITADSVDVLAKHGSRLNTLGVVVGAGGVGAGVGIGVSVLNENSETAAETTNSNITINDGRQENGDVNINADNDTKVNYQLYSTGGGLAGVAGAIGVSNVNSKVNTTVSGTVIGSETTG